MPGFDRRGPMGAGPMTGGGRGLCNYAASGTGPYGRPGQGRRGGFGRSIRGNRRFGGGFGWGAPAGYGRYPMDAASELDVLKTQADSLRDSLEAINKRMAELDKASE